MTGVIQVAKSSAAANGTHCIGTTKYKLATFAHQDIFSEGNTNKLLKQRNSVYSLRGKQQANTTPTPH